MAKLPIVTFFFIYSILPGTDSPRASVKLALHRSTYLLSLYYRYRRYPTLYIRAHVAVKLHILK